MAKARRAHSKFRLFRIESLESRSLLSGGISGTLAGPWVVGSTVNSATAILVKFNTSTTDNQADADVSAVGGRVVPRYPSGPTLVALPPWGNRDAALSQLKSSKDVAYAEADAALHAAGALVPNDPLYSQQWGMNYIDAPSAWGVTTGNSSIIIAVLDTGIDTRNADFAGRLWTNPSPGTGSYRGDVHGWNFVSNNANVQDNNGHGSHVSGILGATGNNGVGVAGINWQARIMPLKVLDGQGNGTTDQAVSAVYYAVQHGAKVINASWGGDIFSQSMLDALNYADRAGVVFVTAAGNDGTSNDMFTTYPASFRTPNELVVAAIDASGNLADYSNFGTGSVDIAAPGTNILSTVLNNQYQQYTGTSMSTPFVSGTAALVAGQHPTWTAEQIIAQIKATAKTDAALIGRVATAGVVDPYFALTNNKSTGAPSTVSLVPNGSTLPDVEVAILTPDSLYAALGSNTANYVSYVFPAILGRAAGSGDIAYFSSAFQNGLTRVNFVRALENGVEGYRAVVGRLFQDELGSNRTLDDLKSDPAVIYLANLLSKGETKADLLASILSSDSYYQNVGANNTAYVSTLYQTLFARPADNYGLSVFSNALASGLPRDILIRSLLAGTEGKQTAVARLYRQMFGWPDSVVTLKSNSGVDYWATFLVSA